MANSLDLKGIMEIIPKVEDYEPGQYCIAYKNITYDESFFRGHFPEYPITPGVLMVEALAQTGAVAILSQEEFKGKIAVFAGIDNCKFKRQILPGDTVRLETKITQVRGPVGVGEAEATVDGKTAVKCTLKFAIVQ